MAQKIAEEAGVKPLNKKREVPTHKWSNRKTWRNQYSEGECLLLLSSAPSAAATADTAHAEQAGAQSEAVELVKKPWKNQYSQGLTAKPKSETGACPKGQAAPGIGSSRPRWANQFGEGSREPSGSEAGTPRAATPLQAPGKDKHAMNGGESHGKAQPTAIGSSEGDPAAKKAAHNQTSENLGGRAGTNSGGGQASQAAEKQSEGGQLAAQGPDRPKPAPAAVSKLGFSLGQEVEVR